jgi:hypothetical protein
VLKNLLPTIKQKWKGEKSSYFISSFIFAILTVIFSWYIQLKVHASISNGNSLHILIAMLMMAWFPVLIAIFLMKIFKFPFQIFLLIPSIGKKMIWAILIPCLVAAIGIKLSLLLAQISVISPGIPLFMNGDTIVGALNLSFLSILPAILFCIVISVGTELIYRAFFIECCLRANIKIPWFFAGIIQFIAFIPFLWFGYFGGGEGNLKYLVCWLLLFIFLSAFHYWLSLSSNGDRKEQKYKTHKIIAKRSLLHPLFAASTYQIIYYVAAARTLSENGNLWMSGPANVITIVIYLIITIFLLMTKRLKY